MKWRNGIALLLCACMAVTACAKGDKPAENQDETKKEDTNAKDKADLTDVPGAVSEPPAPTKFVIPDEVLTPAPTLTPVAAIEELTAEAKEIISQYELISFGSYEVRNETATMVRNSNLNNTGVLCGAEDSTIYFADLNDGKIYHANADGSEQELVLEHNISSIYLQNLQIEDGCLYFRETDALCRYHLNTKNVERVLEQAMSCFTVSGQKVYYCGSKGLCCYDMGTGQDELLVDTGEYEANWMTATEDVLIYTLIDPKNPSFATNALLFAYFFQDGEAKYIRSKAWMPVLAGNRVFFQDYNDGILESLDLNTGEMVSYGHSASRPSINAEKMYLIEGNQLYSYDFQTGETVLCFINEEGSFVYIFQTSEYLYLYQSKSDQIYYYNKIDGTYGKFGTK